MDFDVISWAVGQVAGRLLSGITKTDLPQRLNNAVKNWAKSLPANERLVPEAICNALFLNSEPNENSQTRPALCKLREQIQSKQLPTEKMWFSALLERWEKVREDLGQDSQSFFLLEEVKAKLHIRDLAHKLYYECPKDVAIFTKYVVDSLEEIKATLLVKPQSDNLVTDSKDLKDCLLTHLNNQIEKQKNCRKYIPDIYVEIDKLKDNARYFVAPVTFWPKIIEEINRVNVNYLNSLLKVYGLDEFKIEIPESLKKISNISQIDSKAADLIGLLNGKITYLKTLEELRKNYQEVLTENKWYFFRDTGWKFEGAIHKITWTIEAIIESIHCIYAKVFCITSKAGQGKTNFVCDFAESVLKKRSSPCLYFNARDFNYTLLDKIDEYIVKTVSYDSQFRDLPSFLREIEAICAEENTTFTIIIDGLNEHINITEFSDVLEKLIERLLNCEYVRIILTCRTEYFEQRFGNIGVASFKEHIFFCENINTQMHKVKKERLLNGYLRFFNISFYSMATAVRERLASDPLLLRIFCEAYGDPKSKVPIKLPAVYHIYKEELFSTYFKNKLIAIAQKDSAAKNLRIGYKSKYQEFLCYIIAKMVQNKTYENTPVTGIPSIHFDVLEQMLDEDIILRKDLITQDDILNPACEVINFTFDEFRDYLIAHYLVNNVFNKNPSNFNNLITELIVPDSPIAEGVSRFIFCMSKRKKNPMLNRLIKSTPWYDDIYLDSIFSVSDDLIEKDDIDTICQRFKQNIYESSFIIYSLIHRFDIDTFKNLNINKLIEILINLDENDYEKYVVPVFKRRDNYSYARTKNHFTLDIDDFIKQLFTLLSNEDLDRERRFIKFFELLIYLFPIKNNSLESPAPHLYNKFGLEYPNFAVEQLIKAVEVKNVFTEFLVWQTITHVCENNVDFPDDFVKSIVCNLMKAPYDVRNRQSALSEILIGDSTEARKFRFLSQMSQKKPKIFSSHEIAYITKHYDYFFPLDEVYHDHSN